MTSNSPWDRAEGFFEPRRCRIFLQPVRAYWGDFGGEKGGLRGENGLFLRST